MQTTTRTSGASTRPRFLTFGFLAAFFLLPLLAACGGTEGGEAETAAAAEIPADADTDSLMTELQRLDQELSELSEQVMQDPELQSEQAEVQQMIMAEMQSMDPETEEKMDRSADIQRTLQEGGEGEDEEAMQSLIVEWQELQASLQQTHQMAMASESVSAALDAFRARVMEHMKELDPQAERKLERAEAIAEHLQGQMGDTTGDVPTP